MLNRENGRLSGVRVINPEMRATGLAGTALAHRRGETKRKKG